MLEKAIKKVINVEAKALLQPLFRTRGINLKYFQEYRPTKKEEKNFEKTESTDILSADISSGKHPQFSIYQSQTGKKDQDYQGSS